MQKKPTNTKPLKGRPPFKLDWTKIDILLQSGCSGREIAANLDIQPNTLYDHCLTDKGISFTDYSMQKCAKGDSILRKVQYDKALGGDNSMLIWLGKNRLKQSESPQDIQVGGEIANQFTAFMKQISSIQNTNGNS